MKILVSARNAGAALQNLAFMESARDLKADVEFFIVAANPAFKFFEKAGYKPTQFSGCFPEVPQEFKDRLRSFIDESKPEFILAGLAYPEQGVDEATLMLARELGIPSGVIQDYWGYTGGLDGKNLPDFFFVIDETAAQLTREKFAGSRCFVSGSPKHQRLVERFRGYRPDDKKEKIITFFDQPQGIPGVHEDRDAFWEIVNTLPGPLKIKFRPHPENSGEVQFKTESPHSYEFVSGEAPLEELLLEADVVVTCFSTVGLDHNYLQTALEGPSGSLLYLNMSKPLQAFILEHVGMDGVPGVKCQMGQAIKEVKALRTALHDALYNNDVKLSYWKACRETLGKYPTPAKSILAQVKEIVNKK